jgi:hypothetical protein
MVLEHHLAIAYLLNSLSSLDDLASASEREICSVSRIQMKCNLLANSFS